MSTYLYEGRLLETPEITKSSPDEYWGIEELNDVTLKFDNTDGYFISKIVAEEIRNELVILKRWDENESGSNKLKFEQLGRISSYNITDVAEITVSSAIKDKLNKLYPSKVYALTDFTETRPNIFNPPDDLGKPYPVPFGRDTVTCLYIHCNYTSDYYDYAVAYVGPGQSLKSCQKVYRDGVEVKSTEYTFYDGSQSTPYPGYAFLRFVKEQRSFSGSMHQISADVYGLKLGGTDECRDFATVIENFLSNGYWGMGEAVNAASFVAASTILTAIGSYYCDGCISTQRSGRDILNDMLFAARGKLKFNDSGEWTITIDNTDNDKKAYFGSGEGVWENIIEIKSYYKTPVDEALKKVLLRYRYDETQGDFAYKYERDVFAFGEEKEYQANFIRDHTTADKLTCYLQKRAIYRDSHMDIVVGMEGRFLNEMDLIDLQITRFQIESDFKIQSITKKAKDFDLKLVSHNNLIYTYVAATLNTDPITQSTQPGAGAKDYKNPDSPYYEAPKTPISISGVSWEYLVAGTGEVTARLWGKAFKHPDDINFSHMMVGIRMYGSVAAAYKWYTGYEYDRPTNEWRVLLDFPASGFDGLGVYLEGTGGYTNRFDAQVVSVNTFGRRSAAATYLNEKIGYKDAVVGSTPIVPTKISSVSAFNSFKNFTWYWPPCAVIDLKDYHIQIDDNADFGSPIVDMFVKSNSFSYTTTIAYGSSIYFRVRPRNTTCVEAWQGVNNWTDLTSTVSNTINIPDDSITGAMIAPAVAGTGLTQDGSGNLQVNPDGTTIETSGDTFRVKADGIGASHIADDAVGSDQIADNAVGNAQIADDAVTEVEIRFGTLTSTAGTGGSVTPPITVEGYITVDVNGASKKIAYYPVS